MESTIPHDFTVATRHCLLRISKEDDVPFVFSASRTAGFNDGMVWDPPATMEELYEPFRASLEAWDRGTAYSFGIQAQVDGEFLGRISIRKIDKPNVWNIGFWTHPTHQGKGIMSEVVPAIIAFGFEKLEAKCIEVTYAVWNIASKRILEKAGMSFAGYFPEGFKKRGEWVAVNLMAIERERELGRSAIVFALA